MRPGLRVLDDELIVVEADLDLCKHGKEQMFNFAAHRRPQWYGPIVEQVGAVEPKGADPTPGSPEGSRGRLYIRKTTSDPVRDPRSD